MKRSITAILLMASMSAASAQTNVSTSFQSLEWGAHNSSGAVVDLNNDGYKDLVFAGISAIETNPGGIQAYERTRMAHVILFDQATKEWKIVNHTSPTYFDEIGINVADRPSITPCDINQDGLMDVVAFETPGHSSTDQPYTDHISKEGVFLGNGDGTFSKADLTFVDSSGNTIDFDIHSVLSADVADFNNDGLLDIACVGYQMVPGVLASSLPETNVVLFNQGGGKFMVSHYLTDDYVKTYGQNGRPYHLDIAQVYAYDFNNDGYVDFLTVGTSNNYASLGVGVGNSTHITELYLNDPQHPGQFRKQNIYDSEQWTTPLPTISEGGVAIADYNNDGVPDLFLSGWTGSRRESYVWGVYTNTLKDGLANFSYSGKNGLSEMRNQNSVNTQYAAMDWNGDGEYDIFNQGWSPRLRTQTAFISTGDGKGKFTEAHRIAGVSEGCVLFADWNGDGTNDYVMLGQTEDRTLLDVNGFSQVFAASVNPNTKVTRPDAPALNVPTVQGNLVTLSWKDATTSKRNVTYEYYVKNASGNIVAGGNAFTDGKLDGIRKVSTPGNAYNARTITLSLPKGTYTYGVQTVNAALLGSVFAIGTFTVSDTKAPVLNPDMPIEKDDTEVSGETFSNPVINGDAPDPTVIRAADGNFYLFSTGANIFKSEDFVNWKSNGNAFTEATRPTWGTNGAGIWAPDINYINNQYVLYYAMSVWGDPNPGIGVAVSENPNGPYKAPKGSSGKLFRSNDSNIRVGNSIDPFYIEDNGHKYIFWGSFQGIFAIELADDGLSVKAGAKPIEITQQHNNWTGSAIEAIYVVKHDGYFYLIGSQGSCCEGLNSTYHLSMARSRDLLGPYVNRAGNKTLYDNYSGLLYGSEDVKGPGHNAEWVKDGNGNWWILFHGYDAHDADAGRKVWLDRVYWGEDGWPYMKNMKPSLEQIRPVFDASTGIETLEDAAYNSQKNIHISEYVKDNLNITLKDGGIFSYRVVDPSGKLLTKGKAQGEANIDFYAVHEGLYIVSVTSKTGKLSRKVVKY
ncbi:MAG: family 43 glycosylhydrolase [Prevotella sp.]|jgi:arabinan endo-1,5-alpha-L-arabinosidase